MSDSKSNKIIVVIGATGQQGSGVVDALLATGEFKVRGVTRDPKSTQAQALAKKGVEVVAGNVLEPATIKQALTGAYGFFALTDAWNKEQAEKGEYEIGKALVDVAKEAKVTHFIWASLSNPEKESKGKYKNIPHLTNKAKVEEYARNQGFPYHTYVAAAFYFQNWGTFFQPSKNSDGSYTWTLPVKSDWHVIQGDVHEIGLLVTTAFKNPKGWGNGDFIAQGTENVTWGQVMQSFEKNWGVKVTLNSVSKETFAKNPGGEELAEMFEWFEEYGVFGRTRDINSGHKAKGSALKTFDEFLKEGSLPVPTSTSASK